MKKSLFILFVALTAIFSARADITADWKIHTPFDAWPTSIIETPDRVYFMSRTFEDNKNLSGRDISSNSLFYYDKAGDEIVALNSRNKLSGNAVATMAYNLSKKYLLVVYTDCNMDFIYDDGRVFNLPALKVTSIPGKKVANSITFDNERNRAYLATSFGYVTLNDDKHEVAESRNYGEDIQSIARCGKDVVLCTDGRVFYAPEADKRFNFSDYVELKTAPVTQVIIPLDGNSFVGYHTDWNGELNLFKFNGTTYAVESLSTDPHIIGHQQIAGGYRVTGNVKLFELKNDGSLSYFGRPKDEYSKPATSLNGNELWTLTERKGIRSYKDRSNWTLTRDYMRPNSPATYVATSLAYHPTYGMLAGSNGVDIAFFDFNQNTPGNVSGIKNGLWKEYGFLYSGSEAIKSANNYLGVSIDPQNTNYVWRGSVLGGLMRLNLANPSDIMVLANPSNQNAGYPGFVKVAEDQEVWNILCKFTPPVFTSDGTMWTLYNDHDNSRTQLWYWSAADRAASVAPSSYRPMKKINVPEAFVNSNSDVMIALQRNKNMFVIGGQENGGTFLILDTNGTPEITSDDRYLLYRTPYDQDGGGVSFLQVNNLFEDPETGLVWVMSQRGLFTVNPATAFDNPDQVNRIKVARNDGTNLADYLLNEVNVNHLSIDGEGRKWFSTSNGLVCTSRDGRNILAEFTTDNSYLPSNNVYATAYNPENNSIMVATEGGLVEMFPSGSGGGSVSADSGVRVYPNPVEPDYYGWVRIDNVADGSLVKITDAKGGLVKELGPVQGGSVEWDVSGLNNTRVTTGVYYIMVSPGSGGGNTHVSKILVLN